MKATKIFEWMGAICIVALTAAWQFSCSEVNPIEKPCEDVDCSGHGDCTVEDGQAVCICHDGYAADGLSCIATVACCSVGTACEDVIEADCDGMSLGAGSSCSADSCPVVSACCTDGACTVTTEDDCTGYFLGTVLIGCDPNPCLPPEACCFPDGTCEEVAAGSCTGYPLGEDTSCAADACPAFDMDCNALVSCEVGSCHPGTGKCVYDARYQSLVEALRRRKSQLGIQGMAVAVIEGGEVTFATGLGSKVPGNVNRVRPSTLFRIGPLTMPLTAVATLQLEESGDIDLDEPVTTYLPGLSFDLDPGWAPSITPRHLLTMTSGMNNYWEYDVPTMLDDDALAEFINGYFGSAGYLQAPAGRMQIISCANFYVAGLIVETLTGAYYREVMRDRVWLPLGMERTFLLPEEVLADGDYVVTYSNVEQFYGQQLPPDAYDNGWGRPAAYAFSSVLDLAEFIKFLRDGNTEVLSDDLRIAMQSPQVNTHEMLDLDHFGFGLAVTEGLWIGDEFYDLRIVNIGSFIPGSTFGSSLPGYSAELVWIPGLDFGYVILGTGNAESFFDTMLTALPNLVTLPDPAPEPDLTVDPATYGDYEGQYWDPYWAGCITITVSGDNLRISVPHFDAYGTPYGTILRPSSPDNFDIYMWNVPINLTFLRDGDDQVEYIRNYFFVGEKVSSCPRAGLSSERGVPK